MTHDPRPGELPFRRIDEPYHSSNFKDWMLSGPLIVTTAGPLFQEGRLADPDPTTLIFDLRRKILQLHRVLAMHHQWHQDQGDVGLPDGKGGFIACDMGMEYSDSRLCDLTIEALRDRPENKPYP